METSVHCLFLLVFASCSTWSTAVKSKEPFQWLNSGDSLTMQCSTTETDYEGVYLIQGLNEDEEIFFLFGRNKKLTPGKGYESRLQTKGELNNLQVTLANMTVDDSGVYWCKYRRMDNKTGRTERFGGDGSSMVVVNGRPCPEVEEKVLPSNLVIVSAISAGSVFLLCLTLLLIWLVPRMKKSMGRRHGHARRSDSVYEDMRKSHASHRAHQPPYQTNQYP
ncbi:uncharacterized protein si:rp71-81e14.2 [Anguilla anguilla]|uniref:uncharacterized protein si:rp71-81e14.2 n=1 Tax=Anguilla anguilla TaxID=7936 RepID=UPI0015AC2028|nr:uncharacterized protein si:rp71-81e14.2 [Anguilla anguilla]